MYETKFKISSYFVKNFLKNNCKYIMKKALILFLFLCISSSKLLQSQKIDVSKLKAMKPRNIGPAGMSGRVTAIDVVESRQNTIYAGTASGGLWKSESGGVTWTPIFDKESCQNIGSIAIQQSNPDVVWVGTGEGNPRNSHNSGNGIYRSLDGGNTWKNMGLENSSNIYRIVIDKQNPNTIYAGVIGSAWADSKERGVFKTTDGGETWNKILFVNEKVGVCDMVMDPSNPNKLFAGMWEFRREPWFFTSGGMGSGLYMTYDGGKNWKKLGKEEGLPEGKVGRIGVAISKSNPKYVYAVIESDKNILYRSTDGGLKFTVMTNSGVSDRPFYYNEIYVDPFNENTVYHVHTLVSKSIDGGKNFSTFIPWAVHPDHHAFWVSPNNPNYMIEGNDGGLSISLDKGETWRFAENLPVGQFYHIKTDDAVPYNVYGGLQDNGSWAGPSQVWNHSGIRNYDWQEVLFGDGFDVLPDPNDNRYGYALWQGGNFNRYDQKTGAMNFIKPVHPDGIELRCNWNTGISTDPFEKSTLYFGSQYLFKSTNRGEDWAIISSDLTTNDTTKQKQLESGGLTYDVTAAENHTTIVTVSPSTLQKDLIWVGTDDGNVQLTTNGGTNWVNTADAIYRTSNSPKKGAWVPNIKPSYFKEGEAFVVMNDYRRGDITPYLYRTSDFGKTWKNIASNLGVKTFCLSFIQDDKEANLYFLGTENGLFVSIDAGENWTKWTEGYPSVSTYDMALQRREGDLVLGTFGRSIWIMDNLEPLRELAKTKAKSLEAALTLLPIKDEYMPNYKMPLGYHFPGFSQYNGQNKGNGVMINMFINKIQQELENPNKSDTNKTIKKVVDSVRVIVYDENNIQVRNYRVKIDSALNRVRWGFERKGVRGLYSKKIEANDEEIGGEGVLPGKYKIVVSYGNFKDSNLVNVKQDPRTNFDMETLKSQDEHSRKVEALFEKAAEITDRIKEAKDIMDLIAKQFEKEQDSVKKDIEKQSKEMKDSLKVIEKMINGETGRNGIAGNPSTILAERLGEARQYAGSPIGKPNTNTLLAYSLAQKKLDEVKNKVNDFFDNNWKKYEEYISKVQFKIFKDWKKIE